MKLISRTVWSTRRTPVPKPNKTAYEGTRKRISRFTYALPTTPTTCLAACNSPPTSGLLASSVTAAPHFTSPNFPLFLLLAANAPVGSKNPNHPSILPPHCGGGHDDSIQRRAPRQRLPPGVLVPAAPPALRVRRRVRLLPRLLLLPLPAARLPGAARAGGGPRGGTGGEAPQAAVRPQPGVRAVPPRGPAVVVPGPRRGPRRRLPLPQHHAALHRREPQQGGHPVRRHCVRRHVPRRAARGGGRARVRAAGAQHPAARDPRHRRPLQRAPGRRAGPRPRRHDVRPRRPPHHRRHRRQDPRARLLLPQGPGVGGLRDLHQSQEPGAQIQAVRRGRAERVGTTKPPPPKQKKLKQYSSLMEVEKRMGSVPLDSNPPNLGS